MTGAGIDIGLQRGQVQREMAGNMGSVYDSDQTFLAGDRTNFFYREYQGSRAGDLADKDGFCPAGEPTEKIFDQFFPGNDRQGDRVAARARLRGKVPRDTRGR